MILLNIFVFLESTEFERERERKRERERERERKRERERAHIKAKKLIKNVFNFIKYFFVDVFIMLYFYRVML